MWYRPVLGRPGHLPTWPGRCCAVPQHDLHHHWQDNKETCPEEPNSNRGLRLETWSQVHSHQQEIHWGPAMPVECFAMEEESKGNSPWNKIQGDQLQERKGRDRLVFPKEGTNKRADQGNPSKMCRDSDTIPFRELLLQIRRKYLPTEFRGTHWCQGHHGSCEDRDV